MTACMVCGDPIQRKGERRTCGPGCAAVAHIADIEADGANRERARIADMIEGAEVCVPFELTTVPWAQCNALIVAVQQDLARQVREGGDHARP